MVDDDAALEPLRARRKRELRQQLSDVATRLFLERGFDAVRVADVARACGVTEKTVFNHFRSKESLLADRWEVQTAALRAGLADPGVAPLDAALAVLDAEVDFLTGADLDAVRRFGRLIGSTPSLRAHHREALERLTAAAAEALAARTGSAPDDPAPAVTAAALAGLWPVHAASLHRHLAGPADARGVAAGVRADLRRAAEVLRAGL